MKESEPQHVRHNDYQVICPYCGYEPDETYPEPNGDYEIEKCGRCAKNYYANAEVVYSSKRDCTLNGKECDWQPNEAMNIFTDRKLDWFKCPECLDTKTVRRQP